MNERKIAEVFPPGDFIKEELESRCWSQDDLASIIGRPLRLVNEIITGKRGITPETAKGLGSAFGTSAQLWMNLESTYRLSLTDSKQDIVERRAALYAKAPVRLMIKRGWIEDSNSIDVLEKRLLDFFGLPDIRKDPQFFPAVARKSTSYTQLTPMQNAWLYRASHLAKAATTTTNFTKTSLKDTFGNLKLLLSNPEDISKIPGLLSESGIRFIIIEPFPQSKIDGASFWIDNDYPVIALSLRYDRIDGFWHTLIHELTHVKNEDGRRNGNFALDTDLFLARQAQENRPQYEIEADEQASEFIIPQAELECFVNRTRPLYSKTKIIGFANKINVHPGIVVGQLQHKRELSYAHNREMLVKVRNIITDVALTDGWGRSLPFDI